jgi:hypothetical protein
MKKPSKVQILLIIGIILLCIAIGYAVISWTRTITWNVPEVKDFSVWNDATSGSQLPDAQIVNIGTTPADPYTITYYLQNDGNVAFDIILSATPTGATASWNPTSPVNLPVGTARVAVTLTLSNFEVGAGSCDIQFSIA